MRKLILAVALALAACAPHPATLPPPAPDAVQVLVPVIKPCVPATVPAEPKAIDDPAFLQLPFVETIKGLVTSVLQSEAENQKLRAANDRPCGGGK